METMYLILFIAGLAYAVLTIFIGDIFDFHFDLSGGHLPFISPTTIGAFITVFGGCGFFLSEKTGMNGILIAAISLILAMLVSIMMFFLVVVPLHKSEKSAAYSTSEMIGKTAEVITLIEGSLKGEIIYEQGGSRLSAPAKTADGSTVKQGDLVTIVGVVSGTFIVKSI